MSRRSRVAILHQGFVPPYRVGFYERLVALGDIEYVVFHGSAPPGSGHRPASGPYAFPAVHVRNRWMQVAGRTIVHQEAVQRVERGGFDAVVLGAELKFLSSLALFGLSKVRGRAVVLWGQGADKSEETGRLASVDTRAASVVKARWAAAADAYLVYTEGGAVRLRAANVESTRVHVVHNTLDMAEQAALHERLRGADTYRIRDELGLRAESLVVTFIGRVYAEKRVNELITLVRALNADGSSLRVEAVVVGSGPALPDARVVTAGLGDVHLLGEVRDQGVVARILRVSAAVVIPGKVGLAVNHAFAHGVPLFTRESAASTPPRWSTSSPESMGSSCRGPSMRSSPRSDEPWPIPSGSRSSPPAPWPHASGCRWKR